MSAASSAGPPTGGSAWRHYKSSDVLGEGGAASLIGIFASKPPEHAQNELGRQEKEAEGTEAVARQFGVLSWRVEGVPPPDFEVREDELGFRAELSVFIERQGRSLKEVRLHGPRRRTAFEARKDGCELVREAFGAQGDCELLRVRRRLWELQGCEWRPEDLVGDDVLQTSERRMPAFAMATQADKGHYTSTAEWFHARERDEDVANFQPVGPSWAAAARKPTPCLPGIWYMHERQNQEGRHVPWLFFNASTGKYYRARGETGTWVQTGAPHSPGAYPVTISHGSVCLPAAGGRKDDLAVALPELVRTGSVLKQPLQFLDRPAALYLLVDGLRGSSGAAEFCAKRFHTHFLPLLSASPMELEDHELIAIISDVCETLDTALLESGARYAGCALAVAVVLGRRLAVCTLGHCRAILCSPQQQKDADAAAGPWQAKSLAGGLGGRTPEILETESRRRRLAGAALDFEAAGEISAASLSAASLAALPSEQERAIRRAARAAHPFAALGLSMAELPGGQAAVHRALAGFEEAAQPAMSDPSLQDLAVVALARVREAAAVVEVMMGVDQYGTQRLAELFFRMDEDGGRPSPGPSAALLGLEPGCGEAAAQAAVEMRYRALLSQLSLVAPQCVAQGFRVLAEIADAAARSTTVWSPAEGRGVAGSSVRVPRALGLRDLKRPRKLVGTEVAGEVVPLQTGLSCLVLLPDGAADLSEAQVAEVAGRQRNRPRAACLRLTAAASPAEGEAVSALAMYINVADGTAEAAAAAGDGKPDPKKRKLAVDTTSPAPGRPARVRIAQVLLKFEGQAPPDPHARRQGAPGRTQMDAERELLKLLERVQQEDPKGRTARFAEACREMSDCKSALNTPHADLGWVNPGQWGKEFDAAAFDLSVGGLSDIFVSPRGAHLLLRLA